MDEQSRQAFIAATVVVTAATAGYGSLRNELGDADAGESGGT